ncbi:sigma-70 family RNA polymerase sigma factor [Azospirillum sp. SYSU D00513]|uniref:sigma-70 family RNA polymerase sigma factor n=1 Tax=Azospirillum sp. SYSU D00513 TaxID=2812561 RepID=UPI001A9677F5|nr:sigma-70 family RNA polymerase sigma factor [Azospirillum sp. SYSU D00513]
MPPLGESLENEAEIVSFPTSLSEGEKKAARAGQAGAIKNGHKPDLEVDGEADLLRLYMRDIGRVHHLTLDEETDVIAIIQSSRSAVLSEALRAPGAVDLLLSWKDGYLQGTMPLRDIIEVVGSYEEHRARVADEVEAEAGNASIGRLPIREAALRPGLLAAFDRIEAMRVDAASGRAAGWSTHHHETARIAEGLHLIKLRQTDLQEFVLSVRRDLHSAEGKLLRHAQSLVGSRERAVSLITSASDADELAMQLGDEICRDAGVWAVLETIRGIERKSGLRLDELRRVSASLRASIKAYEGACKRLFCAHAGFVTSIARRFESSGAALVDLIQTGNLGLLRAVEKFEPGRSRFATYAEFWIRQFIAESIPDEVNTVHIASSVADLSRRIARAQEVSLALHMKELTFTELSEMLGESVDRIRGCMFTSGRAVSLDQPVGQADGEDGETPLKDVIADDEDRSPYEITLQSEMSRTFRKLLARLPEQESRVVALRFGLESGIELSPDEAARAIGISRDKLLRIEQSALRALRSPVRSPEVWSYSRQFS